MKVDYKPSTDIIADGLTKPLHGPAYKEFVKQIGLTDISNQLEKRRLNEIRDMELLEEMAKLELQDEMAVSA